MRTKGKIQPNDIFPWDLWIGADHHIASVHGNESTRRSNADHLVSCWNAFEPGGIIERVKKELKIDLEQAKRERWKTDEKRIQSLLSELEKLEAKKCLTNE